MNLHPTPRSRRVRFTRAVRVVPLEGPPRAFRLLAANLSREGMFVATQAPFSPGTRVALSLEAGGRVLPFAQGEVIWQRDAALASPAPGFAVRFTDFLHPRASALVGYLVDTLETGKPLVGAKAHAPRWRGWAGAFLGASLAGALAVVAAFAVLRSSSSDSGEGTGALPSAGSERAATGGIPERRPAPARTDQPTQADRTRSAAPALETQRASALADAPSAVSTEPGSRHAEAPRGAEAGTDPGSPNREAPRGGTAGTEPGSRQAEVPRGAAAEPEFASVHAEAARGAAVEPELASVHADAARGAAVEPQRASVHAEAARGAAVEPERAPVNAEAAPAAAESQRGAVHAATARLAANETERAAVPAENPHAATAEPARASPHTEGTKLAARADQDLELRHELVAGSAPSAVLPAPGSANAASTRGAEPQPSSAGGSTRLPVATGALRALTLASTDDSLTVGAGLERGASVIKAFVLTGPPRFVLDVEGARPPASKTLAIAGQARSDRARVGKLPNGTRVVLDLHQAATLTQLSDGRFLLKF